MRSVIVEGHFRGRCAQLDGTLEIIGTVPALHDPCHVAESPGGLGPKKFDAHFVELDQGLAHDLLL